MFSLFRDSTGYFRDPQTLVICDMKFHTSASLLTMLASCFSSSVLLLQIFGSTKIPSLFHGSIHMLFLTMLLTSFRNAALVLPISHSSSVYISQPTLSQYLLMWPPEKKKNSPYSGKFTKSGRSLPHCLTLNSDIKFFILGQILYTYSFSKLIPVFF